MLLIYKGSRLENHKTGENSMENERYPKTNRMGQWCITIIFLLFLWQSCAGDKTAAVVHSGNLRLEFDSQLFSRVVFSVDNQPLTLSTFSPSEFIETAEGPIDSFAFDQVEQEKYSDSIGSGEKFLISGRHDEITKILEITVYDDYPDLAVYQVKYVNNGDSPLTLQNWTNNHYVIQTQDTLSETEQPPFWTFQDASYSSRPDWVLPIKAGFSQQNYMGMNASDYGGGTPVVDIWTPRAGIAIGHIELVPKLVSLPIEMQTPDDATVGITYQAKATLQPGEEFSTFHTFVIAHQGDYFHSLEEYRRLMVQRGIQFSAIPETSYEPIWCAWGYGRDFTINQFTASLPKVREMGYDWAVLDDGWQVAEGDWSPNPTRFPDGEESMKALVDQIHSEGLKAKLWWAPLAVDPGTNLITKHPEYLLLDEDGQKRHISWWNAYYLDPSVPAVQEYTKGVVEKILKDWDWDGLKIDGQHLNGVPPCYNPAHHHARPEESVEALPKFFQMIYETARSIKPDAVVEICPCGTGYSFYTMPFMNQSVASDPRSSWQIRLKGKTFKALMGPSAPYYGDHVELSDGREDFASTVGIGGVIGTKFTWKPNSRRDSTFFLTPAKEQKWKQWLKIYRNHMLPTGTYLGDLYDIGFDTPETHVVQKSDRFYYAFYAQTWDGNLELRGLANQNYRVHDYVNDRDYGIVSGPVGSLNADFNNFLLLVATPQ